MCECGKILANNLYAYIQRDGDVSHVEKSVWELFNVHTESEAGEVEDPEEKAKTIIDKMKKGLSEL